MQDVFGQAYLKKVLSVVTIFSLIGFAFAPTFVFAQESLCPEANAMCPLTPPSGTACHCPVPGGVIVGVCSSPHVCTGTMIPALGGGGMQSIGSSISDFATAHPILTMFGVGAAMSLGSSLLGSLLAPKTGSSGSDSNYTPGVCTTQYYYTSDANALVDPCAIYNPSSPTNPPPTTCPTVISPLCLNGTLVQQPNDANNCPVAPKCSTSSCPTVVTPLCLTGTLVQQPNDANNCPVAPNCSTTTPPPTGTGDTLAVSPTSGVSPLAVTANFSSGASCSDAYDLSWGDGSADVTMTYSPPTFGSACAQIAQINTPVHTYTAAGTYTPTLRSGTTLQFTSQVSVTVTSPTTPTTPTTNVLVATPASGDAPLTVIFSGTMPGTSYVLNFGDGSTPVTGQSAAINSPYTYTQSGTYQATVQDSSGTTQGSATITVTSGSASTPVPISDVLNSTVYYGDTTSSTTPDASQTPLAQNAKPAPGQGLQGNLLSAGGGATVYATNVTGNTEVSGFFGSNSAPAQLCQSRPWSSNFLSYVIPPTFFDSLCSAAGYPVGASPSSVISAGGGSQNVSVAPPQQSKPQYTGGVHAAATIWARPPSVSLGGRTNIFWISQDVSSCTESSSDGNFTGSSTSGGASTVALSGPVTFTITCLSLDGTNVSNSTTVTIGS